MGVQIYGLLSFARFTSHTTLLKWYWRGWEFKFNLFFLKQTKLAINKPIVNSTSKIIAFTDLQAADHWNLIN